jgi:hypothetical protein
MYHPIEANAILIDVGIHGGEETSSERCADMELPPNILDALSELYWLERERERPCRVAR